MPTNQQEDPNQMTVSSKEAAVELIGILVMMAAYATGLFVALFVVFQAPDIYNDHREGWDTALLPIVEQGAFAEMGEFIRRIGLDASNPEAIPMTIGSPWVIFLLVSVALFQTLPAHLMSLVARIVSGEKVGLLDVVGWPMAVEETEKKGG
jgi:hypothetical protein